VDTFLAHAISIVRDRVPMRTDVDSPPSEPSTPADECRRPGQHSTMTSAHGHGPNAEVTRLRPAHASQASMRAPLARSPASTSAKTARYLNQGTLTQRWWIKW